MLNRIIIVGLLIATASQMGCGSSGVESTTTLTQDQAVALASALGNTLEETIDLGDDAGKFAGKFLPPLFAVGTSSFSKSSPCANGNGTTNVDGITTITQETDIGVLADVSYLVNYKNCEINTDEGDVFEGNGDVTVNVSLNFNLNTNTGTLSANFNGGVDVSGDDVKAGTCRIAFGTVVAVNDTTLAFEASGNICETNIDYNDSDDLTKVN